MILRYDAKIDTAEKAMNRAKLAYDQRKGELASIFRAGKNDGVDIDALKEARKVDAEDHNEVALRQNNIGRYLRLKKSPLSAQLNLFPEVDLPAPVSAALQGLAAGKNAEPAENNPYTPGTDAFDAWARNWADGQQQNREAFERHSEGARLQ